MINCVLLVFAIGALGGMVLAAHLTGLWFGQAAWRWSGGLPAIGCTMAVVAMAAGLMELSRVAKGAPMRDAYLHTAAMFIALTLFGTRLLLRLYHLQALEPNPVSLVLDAGGFLALTAGGWLGGKPIYSHGVNRRNGAR